jgi:hypothetical protein
MLQSPNKTKDALKTGGTGSSYSEQMRAKHVQRERQRLAEERDGAKSGK